MECALGLGGAADMLNIRKKYRCVWCGVVWCALFSVYLPRAHMHIADMVKLVHPLKSANRPVRRVVGFNPSDAVNSAALSKKRKAAPRSRKSSSNSNSKS